MRKIRAYCDIGFVGAEHQKVFEFPDYVSDDEIDQEVQEWAEQHLSVCWEEEMEDE